MTLTRTVDVGGLLGLAVPTEPLAEWAPAVEFAQKRSPTAGAREAFREWAEEHTELAQAAQRFAESSGRGLVVVTDAPPPASGPGWYTLPMRYLRAGELGELALFGGELQAVTAALEAYDPAREALAVVILTTKTGRHLAFVVVSATPAPPGAPGGEVDGPAVAREA